MAKLTALRKTSQEGCEGIILYSAFGGIIPSIAIGDNCY
jgi:hypothetical protein